MSGRTHSDLKTQLDNLIAEDMDVEVLTGAPGGYKRELSRADKDMKAETKAECADGWKEPPPDRTTKDASTENPYSTDAEAKRMNNDSAYGHSLPTFWPTSKPSEFIVLIEVPIMTKDMIKALKAMTEEMAKLPPFGHGADKPGKTLHDAMVPK